MARALKEKCPRADQSCMTPNNVAACVRGVAMQNEHLAHGFDVLIDDLFRSTTLFRALRRLMLGCAGWQKTLVEGMSHGPWYCEEWLRALYRTPGYILMP